MKAVSRLFASPARVAGLLGLACIGLVAASFFVQHVLGVEPCPLCILQRFTYLGLIPIFFAAALAPVHGTRQRVLLWISALVTVAGMGIAGYQTYLQLFPPSSAARCSASLYYMLDNMAVTEVLARLFHASGDCSDTSFKVLGLTLAQASLLTFVGFSLSLGVVLKRRPASV